MIRTIAIVLSALLLGGCPSQTVTDTACTAFSKISYSARFDTEQTKAQIRGHNAAWDRLCK